MAHQGARPQALLRRPAAQGLGRSRNRRLRLRPYLALRRRRRAAKAKPNMLEPNTAKLAGSGVLTGTRELGGPSREKKSVEPGAIATLKFTVPAVSAAFIPVKNPCGPPY